MVQKPPTEMELVASLRKCSRMLAELQEGTADGETECLWCESHTGHEKWCEVKATVQKVEKLLRDVDRQPGVK